MIGLFNECFPPVMDGVAVTVSNLARHFYQRGAEVSVVPPQIPGLDATLYPYSIYQYLSFPVPGRYPYRSGVPQLDYKFQRQMDALDFSILHAHCPFSSSDVALKMSKRRGIPLVATFHSKYRDDFKRVIPKLMQTIYTAADLFLFPSLYDNAPLVVREAASLGTPSLVTRGSNTAEVIRDGFNGFLADNDVSAFAMRLRYILERPVTISWAASRAAQTLVRPWDDIAAEVLDRYRH